MKKAMACGMLLLFIFSFFTGCGVIKKTLEEASEMDRYDLGTDSLSSVKTIVGVREVTGFEKKSGTIAVQSYTYKSDRVTEDLISYIEYLEGKGYVCTEGGEFNSFPGDAQYASESNDAGKIVTVDMKWEETGYTLEIQKYEGTLTTY